jgi:hypothetical protein
VSPTTPDFGLVYIAAVPDRARTAAADLPAALVSVSLGDPRANGVAAWLKLAGKIVRITSSTDQVDHLPAKLRRIRWTCSWHRQHLWRETQGVHQTGSIPLLWIGPRLRSKDASDGGPPAWPP